MTYNYKRLRYACYSANVSMAVIGHLSPLLFLSFRSLYGISYSLLGLLVLLNFCTQLLIDLLFSFYSHRFNLSKTVRLMPMLTVSGLLVYALWPFFFPGHVYGGLVAGTIIFSASSGLAEVLISPLIAEIPSDNPEREMSKLHSIYAWGVVFMVVVSTLFLLLFGKENWQWLALLWVTIPLISFGLFAKAPIPQMKTPEKTSGVWKLLCSKGFLLCILCIFLGGASECIMSQWSSSYLEQALGLPKVWGDVLGVAMFGVTLGIGRTWYAKRGKNISLVLLLGAVGAVVCYLTAALSNLALVGLLACALTGLCTAMLWPGSLIIASKRFPGAGVAAFALMAAGGDLGGSIGPQYVGLVTDFVINSNAMIAFAARAGLTVEQLGMKVGMLSAVIFPLLAVVCYAAVYRGDS
ncbi:MAG: MFS transporter, partial [Angelakisella sp.]